MSDMAFYVKQGLSKRNLYLELIQHTLTKKSREKFTVLINESYEDFIAQYGDALRVEELTWEIGNWWLELEQNGLASGDFLYTLQYRQPLEQLKVARAKLNRYSSELSDLDVEESFKTILSRSIRAKQSTIKRFIRSLEAKGEQGTIEEQKRLVQRRETSLDRYRRGCEFRINQFNDLEKRIAPKPTLSDYEEAYLQVYNECKVR
jgi:DNA-binding MarR family transcriptional regulator